jgi:hypothetical protein
MIDDIKKLIDDENVLMAIDKALKMIEDQMLNPDVFGINTLEALSEASALAGYLRQKGVEEKLFGDKNTGAYLESLVKSIEYIISALKYKIKANIS